MKLDSLLSTSPWIVLLIVVVLVAGKIIAMGIALRKTEAKDRPRIIDVVDRMFRWHRS